MTQMISAIWFGRLKYIDGLRLQHDICKLARTVKSKTHVICLLEHEPVYTVGLRDRQYTDVEEQELRSRGADFHRVKRGGLITFHGPGQLVAYPIMNLRELRVAERSVGVKRYVELVEEVIIRLARDHFKLADVGRTNDPGVWVQRDRKLAAIGVQVRDGITSHGLALNCNTELHWYNHIVPCGLEGKTATSLTAELKHDITVEQTLRPFIDTFADVFNISTMRLSENIK